jgi:hypothetical protein
MKKILAIALLTSALGSAASAGGVGQIFGIGVDRTPTTQAIGGPPPGYKEQHWIAPDGCSYSRAKTPAMPRHGT